MCGRFTLHLTSLDELHLELGVEDILIGDWTPRYNIAPTQDAPVVRVQQGRRQLDALRWGLVPRWADDASAGARAINARVESVADKPTFRDAFARRRCLVPASGFYEWRPLPGERRKQPTLVRPEDGSTLTFGGIWEEWISSHGEVIESFSIVTTDAHGALRDIHDRMPLMLRGHDRERWLQPDPLSPQALRAIVHDSSRVDDLVTIAVGDQVNAASHDAPDCIEPTTNASRERQLELF